MHHQCPQKQDMPPIHFDKRMCTYAKRKADETRMGENRKTLGWNALLGDRARSFDSLIEPGPILCAATLLALLMHLVLPAAAISVNVTVDDTFGNSDRTVIPTYLPANDTWHVGSPSEQCAVCAIKPSMPDTNQILDQSLAPRHVQVTFPGTAV
ncbi:hypothetical protein GSI_11227 [Ganoderma sinense ZZ0214-1]|uniref:Uncharacterized protein n=1 Tax=Ganoderma sinense ZZ0214-1 TaxID=1077348 RepID=A0A2G8RYV7_9APHY|nr:hypothetical protein GSI_11227 [Ganoderma sinense ZZ0214-1]